MITYYIIRHITNNRYTKHGQILHCRLNLWMLEESWNKRWNLVFTEMLSWQSRGDAFPEPGQNSAAGHAGIVRVAWKGGKGWNGDDRRWMDFWFLHIFCRFWSLRILVNDFSEWLVNVEFVFTRQVANIGEIPDIRIIRRIPRHGAKLRFDFLRSSGGGSGMNSSQTRQAPDQVCLWSTKRSVEEFQDIPLAAANAVEFPVVTNSIEEFHLLSSSCLTTFFGICLKGSWLANRPDNGMLDAGHKLKILGARMTVGICWSYWANVANRRNYISWQMCFMS